MCKPGKALSPDTKSADTLILDFSAPRTVRRKRVFVVEITLLWYFVIADWSNLGPNNLSSPPTASPLRGWTSPCFFS